MSATLYQHPNAPVKLDPPTGACCQTFAEHGMCEHTPTADGYVHGPQVSAPSPLLLALRGSLPAEHCAACGEAIAYHYSVSGDHKIDCADVPKRKLSPRNPMHWSDASPDVTCAVRKALLLDCGPSMEIQCASYTHDELLQVARAIAKAATKAIRERDRQDARGAR